MIQTKNKKTEFALGVERRQLKFMCWVLNSIDKFSSSENLKIYI